MDEIRKIVKKCLEERFADNTVYSTTFPEFLDTQNSSNMYNTPYLPRKGGSYEQMFEEDVENKAEMDFEKSIEDTNSKMGYKKIEHLEEIRSMVREELLKEFDSRKGFYGSLEAWKDKWAKKGIEVDDKTYSGTGIEIPRKKRSEKDIIKQ